MDGCFNRYSTAVIYGISTSCEVINFLNEILVQTLFHCLQTIIWGSTGRLLKQRNKDAAPLTASVQTSQLMGYKQVQSFQEQLPR